MMTDDEYFEAVNQMVVSLEGLAYYMSSIVYKFYEGIEKIAIVLMDTLMDEVD